MEEEEESETEALAEDDPEEGEEGVPRRDESESGKGTGHAKEAGDRKFNEPELNEPIKEELEATETPPAATETEERAEDDPAVVKASFPNESDDSSAHILVKVQAC